MLRIISYSSDICGNSRDWRHIILRIILACVDLLTLFENIWNPGSPYLVGSALEQRHFREETLKKSWTSYLFQHYIN